jgi:hypothetical protein
VVILIPQQHKCSDVSGNFMRHIITFNGITLLVTILFSCNLNLTECEEIQDWKISNYRIVKRDCLGPAGPHYYPLSLYQGDKFISEKGFQKDSCAINFQARNDLYVIFDICKNTVIENRPEKTQIDADTVDSIRMYSNDQDTTKLLTTKQAKKFITDWNKSKASDYRDKDLDSVFYPSYQYRLTVYIKGTKKEFVTFNDLINDRTHWAYIIAGREDLKYFQRLWDK